MDTGVNRWKGPFKRMSSMVFMGYMYILCLCYPGAALGYFGDDPVMCPQSIYCYLVLNPMGLEAD